MTLSSRFFADGSYYGQSDLAKLVHDTLPFGYVSGVGSELAVTAPGGSMTIQVGTGRGYINGYQFDVEDSPYSLTVDTADPSYQRIDRVVARLSIDTSKNIILVVKKGTPSATPAAPDLTRSGDTWEISLARITVPAATSVIEQANINDERGNYTVCGIANEQLVNASRLTGTVSWDRINTVPENKLPNIPAEKLPTIPAEKLPNIPAEKLPVATTSSVGVVKIGTGLTVDSTGLTAVDLSRLAIITDNPSGYKYYIKLEKNNTVYSKAWTGSETVSAPFTYTFTYTRQETNCQFCAKAYILCQNNTDYITCQGFTITDNTTGSTVYHDDTLYSITYDSTGTAPTSFEVPLSGYYAVPGHSYTMEFSSGYYHPTTYLSSLSSNLVLSVNTPTITTDKYLVTNG